MMGRPRSARGRARRLKPCTPASQADQSPITVTILKQFKVRCPTGPDAGKGDQARAGRGGLHRQALHAARQALVAMRASNEMGDDAFHLIEEQLDWLEMAGGGSAESGADTEVWYELHPFLRRA